MTKRTLREVMNETVDEIMLADGFDDAFIGIAQRCGQPVLAVYSARKCIDILMRESEMDLEEAWEYFSFNVTGAWMGPQTPIFVEEVDEWP